MNTEQGTPADIIRRLLADTDREIHILRARRNGLATALDTFGPTALPEQLFGDELAEWVQVENPPKAAAEQFALVDADPVVEQSIPLEDAEVRVVTRKPKPKPAPGNRGGRRGRHDYGKVAEIARQAQAEGRPMGKAVAAELGISVHAASLAITKARSKGHEINSPRTTPPPEPPSSSSGPDHAAVAAVAREAAANGEDPADTVSLEYNISRRAALVAIDRAAHAGHEVPTVQRVAS